MNMTRRNFFELLAGVVAAAVVAPKTLLLPESSEAATFTKGTPWPAPAGFNQGVQPTCSAMDFINRRRMVLVIEKYLNHFIFEPNDAITRKQIQSTLSEFLEWGKQRRAIQDYRVICDESNNSPNTINDNELHISVFVAEKKNLESRYHIQCVILPPILTLTKAT